MTYFLQSKVVNFMILQGQTTHVGRLKKSENLSFKSACSILILNI